MYSCKLLAATLMGSYFCEGRAPCGSMRTFRICVCCSVLRHVIVIVFAIVCFVWFFQVAFCCWCSTVMKGKPPSTSRDVLVFTSTSCNYWDCRRGATARLGWCLRLARRLLDLDSLGLWSCSCRCCCGCSRAWSSGCTWCRSL